MSQFTKEELEEALRAIESTIGKCEKVKPKLKAGTAQHTLLVRRIKAFQIASTLISVSLQDSNQKELPLGEYKRLIQTTGLQKGYQEFVSLFRAMRTFMENEMPAFRFTGNIVENNMDYSYFQFTDDALKADGLKIVIAFVHRDFEFQIWLSGVNRKTQCEWHALLSKTDHPYMLSDNPGGTDYILRAALAPDWDFEDPSRLYHTAKTNAVAFYEQVNLMRENTPFLGDLIF